MNINIVVILSLIKRLAQNIFTRIRAFVFGLRSYIKNIFQHRVYPRCAVAKDKIIFQFFYRKLQFKNLILLRSWWFIKLNTEFIFATTYYSVVLVIGYVLIFKVAIFIDGDSLSTFSISSGAMIGGMLAILFSLLTFSVQNAAEKFSAGFFKILAEDKIQNLIFYLLGLFSLLLMLGGVILPISLISLEGLTLILLVLTGISIHLLYVSYNRVAKRIDPSEGLSKVQDRMLRRLVSLRKQAEDASKVILKRPGNKDSREMCLAVSFITLNDNLIEVERSLEFLFDLHEKYLLSGEKNMALSTLHVIRNILVQYIIIRSDCSVSQASSLALLATTSDSHGFLTPNIEALVAVGSAYIRSHNDTGSTKVINVFKDLSLAAIKVKYVNLHRGDNPLFSHVSGYLQNFIEIAVAEKSPETMFQGVNAITTLALAAVDAYLDTEVLDLSNQLFNIATKTFELPDEEKRKRVVYQYALNGQLRILVRLVELDHNLEVNLKIVLERISAMIKYGLLLVIKGGIDSNLFTQTVLSAPFSAMKDLIQQAIYNT